MAVDKAGFAIEIAASLEGQATLEQLDQLSSKLMAGGRDAAFFDTALDRVSAQLGDVRTASSNADAALSASQVRFAELEKASLQASRAAEKAGNKFGGIVPQELFAEAEAAKAALADEARTLQRLEGEAAGARTELKKLTTLQKNLGAIQKRSSDRLGDAATKLSTFRGALGDAGGELGGFAEKMLYPVQALVDLSEWFGRSTAVMVVGGVIIAATTAAFLALGAAAAVVGIKLADNARKVALTREAYVALHPELSATVAGFDEVGRATGLGEDKLKGLTEKLRAAKVSASDMPAALRAVATAEAALGAGGADQFIEQLKTAKTTVGELASDVQTKFGGIVSRQMLGLEAQGARLRTNVGRLFGGLDIDPLLAGMSTLVALFDENTTAGRALKFLFDNLVQPLIDGLTAAIPMVEGFVLGFLIGAMKIFLAIRPAARAIADLLGFNDPTTEETFKGLATAGEVVAYVIAGLLVAFTAFAAFLVAKLVVAAVTAAGAFIAMHAAILLPIVAIVAVGAALWAFVAYLPEIAAAVGAGITAAKDWIVNGLTAAWEFVVSLREKFLQVGSDLIAGLVQGIANGAGAVIGAITGAVGGAINAAKSMLGIASPSKLFAEFGGFTSEGFAMGVEDEADQAQTAMANLVEPPDVPVPEASSLVTAATQAALPTTEAAAGSAAGGINLENVSFIFKGVEGAEGAVEQFKELLLKLVEGELLETGGAAT